jgi:hypothetical protein
VTHTTAVGFATVAGDRHSFWAGLAAKALPPKPFEPVGIAFVTGSISAPGIVEAFEHGLPREHPLRPLFVGQEPGGVRPQPTMNLLLKHGVRSALEYTKSGDLQKARALSNPDLSPQFPLWIWVATATQLFASPARCSKPSLCVSPVPSSAARGPTAALSCIVRDIEPASGERVKDRS